MLVGLKKGDRGCKRRIEPVQVETVLCNMLVVVSGRSL